jgi:hypothetical protein
MSKNPLIKGWKYLTAAVDQQIDENADPKVLIHQAAENAKRQHQEISTQAAAIIGNKNQLEMKLNRLLKDQESLADKARQALMLADKASAEGDATKAQEFSSTAEIYATQLVSIEQELEETKTLHAQAAQNAEQAKSQVQQSEARLKQQLAEADQLLAQANQAQMQETATRAMDQLTAISPDRNVPTLDDVRAKIESRYANAMGAQELMENSVGDRLAEIESAGVDMKASAKLEEIRAQMRGGNELEEKKATAQLPAAEPEPVQQQVTEPVEAESVEETVVEPDLATAVTEAMPVAPSPKATNITEDIEDAEVESDSDLSAENLETEK